MSCPFAEDDAAYVLGALSSGRRLDFERHLADCPRCTRSVRGLAGLPGLLSRVSPSVLEHPSPDHPPPSSTLVPALAREVRGGRRRLALLAAATAVAAAAVAAVVTGVLVSQGADDPGARTLARGTAPLASGVVSRTMAPVGAVPLQASLALEGVTWGTKLDLSCTYDPGTVSSRLPSAVDYDLFVRTQDGHTEQVGSWRSVAGRTMRLSAATATTPGEIASVEIRAPDGRVLLTLAG